MPFIIWDSTKDNPKKPNYTPTLNQQRESIIIDVLHHKLKIKDVQCLTRLPSDTKSTTPRPKLLLKSIKEKEGSKKRKRESERKRRY